MNTRPRLQRFYQRSIEEFFEGYEEYLNCTIDIVGKLEKKIKNGQFTKMVFMGMGCSTIGPELLRDYFVHKKIPIEVIVTSEYNFKRLKWQNRIDKNTLVLIQSGTASMDL